MSHADHEWAKEHIAAHLAGGLNADERARLEAHAAFCAECIAELDAARRFDRSMDELFQPIRPKPGFEERVIRSLRQRPARAPRPTSSRAALAAAALVLLGVLGFIVVQVDAEEPFDLFAQAKTASNDFPAAISYAAAPKPPRPSAGVPHQAGERGPMFGATIEDLDESGVRMRERDGKELSLLTARELAREEERRFLSRVETDHFENETATFEKHKGEGNSRFHRVTGGKPLVISPAEPRPAPAPPPEASPLTVTLEEPANKDDGTYKFQNKMQEAQKTVEPNYFRPGDAVAKKESPAPTLKAPEQQQEAGADKPGKVRVQPQGEAPKPQEPQPAPRKIIRSGEMEFEIEGFDSTVATMSQIVTEEGGFIATVNSDKLPNGKVRGTVVLRCPPERLDTLILKLRGLGELKSQRIGSQDVSRLYFDIESRLRAARTMEERLIKIIKDGKGEIKDLLLAEKELGEWRTKIETLEGEIRYYNNLISLSTLTVTLYEKEIRSPFGITETERVSAGLEVEDVEKAYKDVLAAVADAKGRVTKSELKQLAAGQFNALVHFEVAPAASGPLRDRLKQIGLVTRLDVNRVQQTEGGSGKVQDIKVKQKDSEFYLSIYNLANIAPRETVHLSLATVDTEKAYKEILDRVEKAAGRVLSSHINRQKSDQTMGVVDFEVKSAEAEAVLIDVRATGEVMHYQVMENPDQANVTRAKRRFIVNIAALGTVQARESSQVQLASTDVAAGYRAILEAVRKAEGRILSANLNENDRRNVTASLSFDVRREHETAVADAMAKAGEVYTRTSQRAQDAVNVVDSKVQINLTLFNAANIPPRENVMLAISVNDVDAAVAGLHAIVAEAKGRVHDSHHTRDEGRSVSRIVIDVPFKMSQLLSDRIKKLGDVKLATVRPNAAVPDSDLAIARLDVTLSKEKDAIVADDSKPWASIKKGLSVSLTALSWSLTLVIVGLCLVLPIGLIAWFGWKVMKKMKAKPAAAA